MATLNSEFAVRPVNTAPPVHKPVASLSAPTVAPQQAWQADDARVLASIDRLTARIDHALTAPGSPWPIAEIREVLRDTLALLRSEITR